MAFVAKHRGRRSRDGEDLLFSQKDGTPLNDAVVTEAFRRLRTLAGIKRDGGARNQPRLHDLRHSAAVHRVTSWYRSGADLNDLLPKLATYLGHKNLVWNAALPDDDRGVAGRSEPPVRGIRPGRLP